MRNLTGKDIAISGISAALAIIFVIGAIYISFMTIPCYVLAAISISLPLIKRNFIASLLSYVVAALVAFFVGNIRMLPFVFFFGLYALVQWLLDFHMYEKWQTKTWIKITVDVVAKIAFFAAAFCALYFLMNLTVADFNVLNIEWNMPLLVFVCFIIFVLYDIVYREIFRLMIRIIGKRI